MTPYIFIIVYDESRTWYSVEQACKHMEMGKTQLYELINDREISFSRKKGKYRFKRPWMDAYLEENYERSAPEIAKAILRGERAPSMRRKRRSYERSAI